MAYQGDRVKKEKEALDLIIKMRKGAKGDGNNSGELIFFVVIPVVMAVICFQYKPILEFAAKNEALSAAIRAVYPGWKSAEQAVGPGTEAAVDGTQPGAQQAVPSDGQPGGEPAGQSGESGQVLAPGPGESPAAQDGGQNSAGAEPAPAGRRGDLLR